MRLLSWNVAGRRARLPEQAAAVVAASPDVVCLQEVTAGSLPEWRAALAEAGLGRSSTPLDEALPPRPRRYAAFVATRVAHERIAIDGLPWPERAVHVAVGGIEVLCAHSPISPSPGMAKVLTHEALYAHVRDRRRIVLAGDLNTPRRDLPDGSVLTFAHESDGTLRPERGERWHEAERALVHRLRAEHGWRDPYLDSGTAARTWTFKENRGGWRLDHLLVRDLDVAAHTYLHDLRLAGLSDHSALLADLRGVRHL